MDKRLVVGVLAMAVLLGVLLLGWPRERPVVPSRISPTPDGRGAPESPGSGPLPGLGVRDRTTANGRPDFQRVVLVGTVKSAMGPTLGGASAASTGTGTLTDAAGRFELVLQDAGGPGPRIVRIRHADHREKEIPFEASAARVDLGTVVLEPVGSRRVRVIDEAGRGIAGVATFATSVDASRVPQSRRGMRRRGLWAWRRVGTTDESGWVDVGGGGPEPVLLLEGRDRQMLVRALPPPVPGAPTTIVMSRTHVLRIQVRGDVPLGGRLSLVLEGKSGLEGAAWAREIEVAQGSAEVGLPPGDYRLLLLLDDLLVSSRSVRLSADSTEVFELGRSSVLEVRSVDSAGGEIARFSCASFSSNDVGPLARLSSHEVGVVFRASQESREGRALLVVPWSLDPDARADVVIVRAEGYEIGWTPTPRVAGVSPVPVVVTLVRGTSLEGRLSGVPSGSFVALHLVTSSDERVRLAFVREQAPRVSLAEVRADGSFRLPGLNSGTYDLRLLGARDHSLALLELSAGEAARWEGVAPVGDLWVRAGAADGELPSSLVPLGNVAVTPEQAMLHGTVGPDGVRFTSLPEGKYALGWPSELRLLSPGMLASEETLRAHPRVAVVGVVAQRETIQVWGARGVQAPIPVAVTLDAAEGERGWMAAMVLGDSALDPARIPWVSVNAVREWHGRFPPKTRGWFLVGRARPSSSGGVDLAGAWEFDDASEFAKTALRVPATGTARVRVVDARRGMPAPVRTELVWAGGPAGLGLVRSAPLVDGSSLLAELPPGRYDVRAVDGGDGRIATGEQVVVEGGKTIDVEVTLR
jgi:hypothetical protein